MRITCLTFAALVVACESTSPTQQTTLAGRYEITVTESAASCTPLALPLPLNADTTQYVQPPNQANTFRGKALARLDGSSLTWIPLTTRGEEATSRAITGNHVGIPDILVRTTVGLEGQRAGGRVFTVSTTQVDTATFIGLVLTPPGHGLQWDVNASGTITSTYHEGSAVGPVFTTCTYRQTLSGTRQDS